jgi:hypothetical protein
MDASALAMHFNAHVGFAREALDENLQSLVNTNP